MPKQSREHRLAPTRLFRILSNLSAQGFALIENDRILRLQRLAEAAATCGPPKTPSEAEFIRLVRRNGQFSLELVVCCVFTMWYIGTTLVHLHSFHMDLMVAVRCKVPALEKHFDFYQIVDISVKNHTHRAMAPNEYCNYDLRNYTDLVTRHNHDYASIMEEINNEIGNPKQIPCEDYVPKCSPPLFKNAHHGLRNHCIREDFMLFCSQRKWYILIGEVRSIGLTASAIVVGLSADIHGRKPTFIVTSLLHLTSYAIMILPTKWGLLVGRFTFGCGQSSVLVLFTLFIEKCNKTTRVYMANLILLLYPIAHCAAYFLCQIMNYWRAVFLANMSMLLVLPFGIWYLVESPRWLMFTKRRAAAWRALQAYEADVQPNADHIAEVAPSRPTIKSVIRYFSLRVYTRRVKACIVIFTLCGVFNDISKRLSKPFRHLFGWPYYLSYVFLQMIVSLVAYLLSVKSGVQRTLFVFCMTLGVIDVILLVERLEFQDQFGIFGLVLFHKTLGISVYCLITYYLNELFPTPCRVTAVSMGMSLHWLGRIAESYIIGPLTAHSTYLNHLPAVVASLSCALAVTFLPNTHTELLADKPYDSLYPGTKS